jgi:hypothetical protein
MIEAWCKRRKEQKERVVVWCSVVCQRVKLAVV